jgi:hypothetical protein
MAFRPMGPFYRMACAGFHQVLSKTSVWAVSPQFHMLIFFLWAKRTTGTKPDAISGIASIGIPSPGFR